MKLPIMTIAITFLLSGCLDVESYDEKMARTCGTPAQAFQVSKNAIKENIKFPESSKFPESVLDDKVEYKEIDDCTTLIESQFNAQNGFGAFVRSYYSVEIKYSKRKDSWSYSKLKINQQ